MKKVRNLIPLLLLCGLLFSGYTKATAQAMCEVSISLPEENIYNEWVITFTSTQNSSEQYIFTTDDDNYWYSILGSIPQGNYNIEFNSGYSGTFDFGVHCGDFSDWNYGPNYYTWYNAPITESHAQLTIDF